MGGVATLLTIVIGFLYLLSYGVALRYTARPIVGAILRCYTYPRWVEVVYRPISGVVGRDFCSPGNDPPRWYSKLPLEGVSRVPEALQ